MIYDIEFSKTTRAEMVRLKRSEPSAFKKLMKMVEELRGHPTIGTGHPEPLTGDKPGQWSRRITRKHRLIYQVKEEDAVVYVLSAYGHYDDK
ncbi:MAG: Txe/YoeB family addiction module toxin [Odoribacteraceae bacterium]|jgi:toxin YoeB|nr:Txe/YoeB family addiction module toxin [Odoribacteraceae bacterium]